MITKTGVVTALLAGGLLLGAPFASATTPKDDDKPEKDGGDKGSSVVDNRGCQAGSGILNISCNPIGINVGDIL